MVTKWEESVGHFLSEVSLWPADRVDVSAWIEHVPFAFWLVDKLRPRIIVELGTYGGTSYLSFCQAVDRLGLQTSCYAVDTWQGDAHAGFYGGEVLDRLRKYHDARYGSFSTLVQSTFDDAVEHFIDRTIDLLHVDGRHFYDDILHDFETWLPKLSERAIVLIHDTNARLPEFGVFRFWDEVKTKYPSFEFIHGHGLGVIGFGNAMVPSIGHLFQADEEATGHIRKIYSRLGRGMSAELLAAINANEADRANLEIGQIKSESERLSRELAEELEKSRRELANVRIEKERLFEEMEKSERALADVRVENERRSLESERGEASKSAGDLERLRHALAEAQRENDQHLSDVMDAFQKSSSWRITAPLRGARLLLDKIRGS